MSRDRLENLWCIDKCAKRKGTYEMNGYCANCGREYVLVIPKTHDAPGGWRGWICTNCGCARVGVERRLAPAAIGPTSDGGATLEQGR